MVITTLAQDRPTNWVLPAPHPRYSGRGFLWGQEVFNLTGKGSHMGYAETTRTYGELLGSQIDHDMGIFFNCNLSTPLHSISLKGIDVQKRIESVLPAGNNTIVKHIAKNIGHFLPDPRNAQKKHKFNRVFSFNGDVSQYPNEEKVKQYIHDKAISHSRDNANAFFNEICDLADDNRHIYCHDILEKSPDELLLINDQDDIFHKSRIFIFGPRGIGKTFFFSYLLMVNHTHLVDDRRIIWVNVDLSKQSSLSVQDQLRLKMCHLIFNKYMKVKYNPFNISVSSKNSRLKQRIINANPEIGEYTDKEYSDFIRDNLVICKKGAQKIGGDFLAFYQGFYDYLCIDHELSFIFVLDGIDQIDLTPQKEDTFNRYCNDIISTILDNDYADSGVYLITMRNATVTRFGGIPHFRYTRKVISETYPVEVLNNRTAYIGETAGSLPSVLMSHMAPKQKCDFVENIARGYVDFIIKALAYRFTGLEEHLTDCGICNLLDFFGRNYRRLFESLKNCLPYFMPLVDRETATMFIENGDSDKLNKFNNKIGKKHYIAVEGFLLAGYLYMLPNYHYYYDKDKKEFVPRREDLSNKAYLANVFAHPWNGKFPNRTCLLCGVRILQYLKFNGGCSDELEIVDDVNKMFGYPKSVVRVLIKELEEYLVVSRPDDGDSIVQDEICLTQSGRYLLKYILVDVEYLYLCLQATPMPKTIIDKSYFPIAPYTDDNYVIKKIICTTNFVRLIGTLEEKEKDFFTEAMADNPQGFSFDNFNGYDFTIADKILDGVSRGINPKINKAWHDQNQTKLKQQIISFIDNASR